MSTVNFDVIESFLEGRDPQKYIISVESGYNDNFVDLVIFGHQDESSPKNRIEPITICLSDGKGGYDLTELVLQPPLPNEAVVYEHGSVADLNGDKIPDLLIMANPRVYVFWGISTFPYFTNKDFLVSERNDLPFYCKIKDINKDGINDVMIGTNIENQIFLNDGRGTVLTNKITVPYVTQGNVFDYIVDDLNSDGLNDFINISDTQNNLVWSIDAYIQEKDGTFKRDVSWIEYSSGTKRGNYRNKLIYYDFDGDGKKDIISGGNQAFARIKFGEYSAGRGDVLINTGGFKFKTLSPMQTGIKVSGDVRNALSTGRQIIFGINNQKPMIFQLSN